MNHGKLIQQFGRLVEQGHPAKLCVQFKEIDGEWYTSAKPAWDIDTEYRVALAFVEGKPVFENDQIYHKDFGLVKAFESTDVGLWSKQTETSSPIHGFLKDYSWNPPKPKEVTIEISRECAEYFARNLCWGDPYHEIHVAAKKALENE